MFLILGLPGSRTAWLSNFLTTDESVCFHEGWYQSGFDLNRLKWLLKQSGGKYVGVADTALALFKPVDEFPGAKILIIDQDVEKSIEWSNKVWGIDCTHNVQKLKGILDEIQGKRVKFEEIDDKLEEIWEYCLPGKAFPHLRAELLKNMIVIDKITEVK